MIRRGSVLRTSVPTIGAATNMKAPVTKTVSPICSALRPRTRAR